MPLSPEAQAEIEDARATPRQTLRAVSEGMEAHLYTAHSVLDHGFVRVIDYMGDDAAIVQAARVSYGAGTKKAPRLPPITMMRPGSTSSRSRR